jgi:probable phosphoglycerate mutase
LNLHVIRHGDTAWSLSGRHTGLTDLCLSPQGEQQADRLMPWLAKCRFTLVLCSPLLRARQTCERAGVAPPLTIDPDLAEWDYGDYEGQSLSDIVHTRADWDVFADGCPGGETPEQVSQRADRVIARCGSAEGEAALFTHGAFSSVLTARWIGLAVAEGSHFCLGTASLAVLGHRPGHPGIAAIRLWNATPGSKAAC